MVHVLESTLESTYREVKDNSGIGSNTPGFSLYSASAFHPNYKEKGEGCGRSLLLVGHICICLGRGGS
jgi:hypothetical protein